MASLKQQLVDYLSRGNYQPMPMKSLAKKLGIKKNQRDKLESMVESLKQAGKVREGEAGTLLWQEPESTPHHLIGVLSKTSTGNGYVILHPPKPADLKEDIFIDKRDI